jgi:hypothetical protein
MRGVMKTIRVFLSGVAVYFLVAILHACGGSTPAQVAATSSGAGGNGGAPDWAQTATTSSGKGGAGGLINPVPDAEAESGSRIKVQWLTGEDGSKQFAGFYDSVRSESCLYYPMSDGKRHCAPFGLAGYGLGVYYADAACAMSLAYVHVSSCPANYAYASSHENQSCGALPTWRIYTLGAKVVPAMMYQKSGANCNMVNVPADYEFRVPGPEMQPSLFVAASLVTDT